MPTSLRVSMKEFEILLRERIICYPHLFLYSVIYLNNMDLCVFSTFIQSTTFFHN